LLGITRHALKRRMIKHRIEWPQRASSREPRVSPPADAPTSTMGTPSLGIPHHRDS
jgi:hypothetical protein